MIKNLTFINNNMKVILLFILVFLVGLGII